MFKNSFRLISVKRFRLWKNGVRLYRLECKTTAWSDLATPFFRTSAGTGNEYTLLISEILSPHGGTIPKGTTVLSAPGNRSFSEGNIKSPGEPYIASCQRTAHLLRLLRLADMWYSFSILRKYEIDTLDDFNRKLVSFLSSASGMPQNAIEQIFQDSDVPAVLQLF